MRGSTLNSIASGVLIKSGGGVEMLTTLGGGVRKGSVGILGLSGDVGNNSLTTSGLLSHSELGDLYLPRLSKLNSTISSEELCGVLGRLSGDAVSIDSGVPKMMGRPKRSGVSSSSQNS